MTLSTLDRLDILDLLARADNAATRRDAGAYVSYFTDDAVLDDSVLDASVLDDSVLDGVRGEHRGKVALGNAVGPVWAGEGPATTHLTLNAVIDSVDGHPEKATATSTLVILDGGPGFAVRHVATIVQQLEKVDQVWRIARRTVSR